MRHRSSYIPLRNTVQRNAFTLMEVLLVLVILVILGSMAAGLFSGTQKRANISAAKAQVGLFKSNIERYQGEMNVAPSSLEDLIVRPSNLDNPERWSKFLNVNELPKDPWGNDYKYAQPGTHNTDGFDVWSMGPDKTDGTDDDIGNW